LRNLAGIALDYHHLGIVQERRENYPAAKEFYQQSLTISKQLGDQAAIARTLHQLGILQALQGDYPSAEKFYRQSLAIKERLNDQEGIAQTYGLLGFLAEQQGDVLQAIINYENAWNLFNKIRHKPQEQRMKENFERIADDLAEEFFRNVDNLELNKEKCDLCRQLVQVYRVLGDTEMVYTWCKQARKWCKDFYELRQKLDRLCHDDE